VAARAPVIDLVALDPNNPRSAIYQLARIETHLAALPKRATRAGCRRPSRWRARWRRAWRTADAAAFNEDSLMDAENALMRLSMRSRRLFHLARALGSDAGIRSNDLRRPPIDHLTTMPHRWRMRIICCA